MNMQYRRALSIQSHVVSGNVGNKCAVFPLQLHGIETDYINSCQLSNHLGYKHFKGQSLPANELNNLIEGIKLNRIDNYDFILTGYIGAQELLKNVGQTVREFKAVNPKLIFACDPVMGDNGRMYVPEDLTSIYRDEIIPLADVVFPNQYEAEWLTDMKITSYDDAQKVLTWFHEKGVRTVVISSIEIPNHKDLYCVVSHKQKDGELTQYQIVIPRLPVNFTGSGDLFASLFIGGLNGLITKTNNEGKEYSIKDVMEKTVATMRAVLTRTYEYAKTFSTPISENPLRFPAEDMELKIVQSLHDILSPKITLHASLLKLDQ